MVEAAWWRQRGGGSVVEAARWRQRGGGEAAWQRHLGRCVPRKVRAWEEKCERFLMVRGIIGIDGIA